MSELGGTSADVLKKLAALASGDKTADTQPSANPLITHKTDRRGFLDLTGKITASLVTAAALGSPPSAPFEAPRMGTEPTQQEAAEVIKPKEKRLVFDFFDLSIIDKQIEQHIPPDRGTLQDILKTMGIDDPTSEASLKKARPKNEAEEKLVLLLLLKNRYQEHGKTVVDIGRKVSEDLREFGIEYQEPETADASGALQIKELSHDEKGNPTLNLFLSDHTVKDTLEQTDARDVGMSLEMGDFSLLFEMYDSELADPDAIFKPKPYAAEKTVTNSQGKEITITIYRDAQGKEIATKEEFDKALAEAEAKANTRKQVPLEPKDRRVLIEDGYLREKAYENLSRMVDLAEQFPDKTFVVAGGNPREENLTTRPDIRDARTRLLAERKKWPNNLIIVGAKIQRKGEDYALSLGCDIYVDENYLQQFDLPPASSYATPVIRELVSIFADKDFSQDKIHAALKMSSDKINTPDGLINVLDMDKIKTSLEFNFF